MLFGWSNIKSSKCSLPSDVSLMKENDSQQPKGAEPIRKSDSGLGAVCINGGNQCICCQDQNKHSTWHIIQSKLWDCLWLGLALHAGWNGATKK